jgi:hypothetical protein
MSVIVNKHSPAVAPRAARRAMARKTATACAPASAPHTAAAVGITPPIACRVRARRQVSPSGHQAPAVVEEKVVIVAAADWSAGASRAAGVGTPTSNAAWPSAIDPPERWKHSMRAMALAGVSRVGALVETTHLPIDATTSSRTRGASEAYMTSTSSASGAREEASSSALSRRPAARSAVRSPRAVHRGPSNRESVSSV